MQTIDDLQLLLHQGHEFLNQFITKIGGLEVIFANLANGGYLGRRARQKTFGGIAEFLGLNMAFNNGVTLTP